MGHMSVNYQRQNIGFILGTQQKDQQTTDLHMTRQLWSTLYHAMGAA